MKLSNSKEEYLKTIYILETTNKQVRVTDIAKRLNRTKATVNYAINSLKADGLINYEIYGKISLTQNGKRLAKEIVKRFDVLKVFLTDILEVEENLAKEEAMAMKHAVSKDTAGKLDTYINKIFNIGDLDCDYDPNSKKCKNCIKITARNRMNKENE